MQQKVLRCQRLTSDRKAALS